MSDFGTDTEATDVDVIVPDAPESVTRVSYRRGKSAHTLFVDSVTPEGDRHVLLRAEGLVKLIPAANIVSQEVYFLDK